MLVTVPLPDAATAAARRAAWPDMRVDVNRVDADRLRVLPGIGPTLAVRIASDRDERGPFASMDDLTRVRRIGPDLVTRIRPFAYAGRARETPAAPTIGRTAP
ncbi:MAG: helix-hairpin-helix domain-containing protein [Phycisphaerales bacterium]|nr:helix-hairpin-helix domain-containing protein [Phycisphaerae bacterium]NNF44296.1 helix-hairpin-helix domain-containing protein [Phycisphaerales bacterium]NNM25927.1 helix-hairpin-helix domain-containing protein [Phycisphaerales bacterium]